MQDDVQGPVAEDAPWSAPPWTQPPEPPRNGGRAVIGIAGALMLVFVIAMAGAGMYLFGNSDSEEAFDEMEVEQLVAEKQRELASQPPSTSEYDSDASASDLYVDTSPSGAVVLLDGDSVGVTPLEGRAVAAGVYVLEIRKERYAPVDSVVFVLENEPAPYLFVVLDPLSPGAGEDRRFASTARAPERDTDTVSRSASPAERRSGANATSSASSESPAAGGEVAERDDARPRSSSPEAGRLRTSVSSDESQSRTAASGDERRDQTSPTRNDPDDTAAESGPATGLVTVLVRPWGSIYLDGKLEKLNTDVQHTASLPVGRHVVRAEHPSLGSQERVVEIRSSEPQTVVFDLLEAAGGETESGGANADDASARTDGGEPGDPDS